MSFTVHENEWGFYVTGRIPMNMMTALLDSCPNKESAQILTDVAGYLNATLVVAHSPENADAWRKQIDDQLNSAHGVVMTPEKWRNGRDTGISSKTIFNVMMGLAPDNGLYPFGADTPCDPSDFGPCYRLLEYFPEWRKRLSEVAEVVPKFSPLIERWSDLEKLWQEESPNGSCPKLYALMKQLNEGRETK